eukprot:997938-Alexandrium_andersonii.AAC.1
MARQCNMVVPSYACLQLGMLSLSCSSAFTDGRPSTPSRINWIARALCAKQCCRRLRCGRGCRWCGAVTSTHSCRS